MRGRVSESCVTSECNEYSVYLYITHSVYPNRTSLINVISIRYLIFVRFPVLLANIPLYYILHSKPFFLTTVDTLYKNTVRMVKIIPI